MGEQLDLSRVAIVPMVGPEAAWLPLAMSALDSVRNQWSENTKKAYRYGIVSWERWCREYGEADTMPPNIMAVLSWLHWQADVAHYAPKTINLHLSGLAWVDRWSRSPNDCPSLTRHHLVHGWRRGRARSNRLKKQRAAPPSVEEIRELISGCFAARTGRQGPSRTPHIAARDRAMFLIAYYGAMRRAEIAALHVSDVVITGRALEITWRASKTDQDGLGEMRAIFPQPEAMMCPVDAWHRWLEFRGESDPEAPAFVSVDVRGRLTKNRLSYSSIDRLLKARCRDAGIRPLSPHQLRAAFATHALENHEEGEVAHHGRWASRSTMDQYVRRAKTWRKNPTIGLLG